MQLAPFILATHDWVSSRGEEWALRRRRGCWAWWLVMDGRVRWQDGPAGQPAYIRPGQVLWRWQGIGGRLHIPAGGRVRGVEFDVTERERQAHQRYGFEPVRSDQASRQPLPKDLFGRGPQPILDKELAAVVATLLEQISSRWWRGAQDRQVSNLLLGGALARFFDYFGGQANDWVQRAEQHARRGIRRGIGVVELAAFVGMPLSTFTEAWQRERGELPSHFLRQLRLQQAADDLLQTSQSVAAVARACGYGNAASFGRAFRLYFGCSPMEYRRRQR